MSEDPHPEDSPLGHLLQDDLQFHRRRNPFRILRNTPAYTRPAPIPPHTAFFPRALCSHWPPGRTLSFLSSPAIPACYGASLLARLACLTFGPCFDGLVHPALGILEDLMGGLGKEPHGPNALGHAQGVQILEEGDRVIAQQELGELAQGLEVGNELLSLQR